nr:hypothetical protein [Tanacetum cinerariifolium]
IITHLPDIGDAKELSLVLGLLTAQPDAPKEIGVVQFLPESCEIVGWAVNLASPTSPVKVQLESHGASTGRTRRCHAESATASSTPGVGGCRRNRSYPAPRQPRVYP